MAKSKITMAELKKLTRSKSFVPQASNLKQGDKGDDVKRLQDYLTKFGFMESPSTEAFGLVKARVGAPPEQEGNFDKNTKQALTSFQRFYGLKATGKMDNATLELMSRPRCGFPDTADFVLEGRKWNKLAITYSYSEFTSDLSRAQVRSALTQAFNLWAAVTPLTFAEVTSGADIVIRFVAGNHGDGSNFDGPSGVLAHGFYPPPNGGSLAGDVHFDEAEAWTVNLPPSGIDLVTVAGHEIGHALGLAHSNESSALMFAMYSGAHRNLVNDDIRGIQGIYQSLIFSPSSVSFGGTPLRDIKTRTLRIKNNRAVNVTVSFPRSRPGAFRWAAFNAVIAPQATRNVLVEFIPRAQGSASTTLTVSSNAPGSPNSISLSGRGIPGEPL